MHHASSRALTPRAIAMLMAVAGFAFMLAMALAQTARAAGPSLTGAGLHISTGALVDPVGRTWVSDHNGGFCRMTEATEDEPGTIEHPTEPGGSEARTCLGGLLPEAAVGPDAAGAPVFIDPTPQRGFEDSGDEVALVPDGASPSDSVWRLHWNPDTRKFEGAEEIHMTADPNEDRPRPVAVTMGSDGNAYVVFQRSGTIQRIDDPAGDSPSVSLVASTSDGRGASAVAAVPGPLGPVGAPTIVVAEATGLTQTSGAPSPNPAAPRNAVPSAYQAPATSAISALAYRPAEGAAGSGTLYAGTADTLTADAPLDRLLRFDRPGPANAAPEADRFAMIGGLAIRPGSDQVLVLDDPALVTEGEPLGMGRLFQVGTPYARIASGPSTIDGQPALDKSHTADSTPDFTFNGDASQECAVAPVGERLSYSPCTSPFTASANPEDPTEKLGDGAYRFAVRSFGEDGIRGRADSMTFTIDTEAPQSAPEIISPAEGSLVTNNPYFEFEPAKGETEYGYECKLDDATEFSACDEGRRELENGEHTLVVRPVDGAGNPGDVSSETGVRKFTVGPDEDPGTLPEVSSDPLPFENSWANYARGLHIASGVIEAPDGRLWVSDHNGGFCRIVDPTNQASGRIDHPERAGQQGVARTCLGGLLPEAREGADAAGQPALVDPTPGRPGSGDEVVLVPDGATKQFTLWRAQWNPATKRFDPLDAFAGVTDDPDRGPRPTAAAVGHDPDGTGPQQPAVYYVTKEQPWVVRINNPASAEPTTDIVGYANDGGRSRRAGESIAVGTMDRPGGGKQDVVYVGEAAGVTRLIPSQTGLGFAVDPRFVASPVALEGVVTNAGLAYDRARNQLYVGSANGVGPAPADVGVDRVRRYSVTDITAASATHTLADEIGEFSMVGGLGLRADGRLLVTDDVALITEGEPMGMGRLVQVGGASARIASGPTNAEGLTALDATHTGTNAPAFQVTGDGAVECWVRPADSAEAPAFEPCEGTFTASELADGEHLLTVRGAPAAPDAPADATTLVPDTLAFTVDTEDPEAPGVDVTRTDGVTSAAPWFTFTAAGESGEGFVWRCRLNDAEAETPCAPGRTFPLGADGRSQLDPGDNTLSVRAIDPAGRSGAETTLEFEADTSFPTVDLSASAARQQGTTAAFAFAAGEAATYACAFGDDGLGPCPAGTVQSNGSGRAAFGGLSDGAHTLRVRARDARGNLGPIAERTVVLDNRGPDVSITSPAEGATTGSEARVAWSIVPASIGQGETGWTYTCTLDGAPLPGCTNPMDLTGLGNGGHTLTVTARDDLGNVGRTATRTWNVNVPPAAQVAGPVRVVPAAPTAGVLGASAANATVGALRVTPTLAVTDVRTDGIPVTVSTAAGTTTVQIRVFQVTGGPAARAAQRKATAKRKLVATVYKRTSGAAKTYRFKLKDGKLRRLQPGRYVVEVRAGTSRTRLGKAKTKAFVVRGR